MSVPGCADRYQREFHCFTISNVGNTKFIHYSPLHRYPAVAPISYNYIATLFCILVILVKLNGSVESFKLIAQHFFDIFSVLPRVSLAYAKVTKSMLQTLSKHVSFHSHMAHWNIPRVFRLGLLQSSTRSSFNVCVSVLLFLRCWTIDVGRVSSISSLLAFCRYICNNEY